MTRFAVLALFAATPALAHPGPHVHPHGGDTWLILGLALIVVAGGLAVARARGRR